MQVDLPKGILAIHGRVGDYIFRSRKQHDGTYKVFAHYAPKRNKITGKNESLSNHYRTIIEPSSIDNNTKKEE